MTVFTTDGTEPFSVSKIFGGTIASPFDQHVICSIIGKTGQGKSNAALDIAYKTSLYMVNKLGGVPEDYFTLKNVAIISMDSIIDVMKNMKKQNIYVFDDIGTGWNARDFAKNSNKIMNNIIQTFRKWQTLLILTMPDTMLIDAVPRNLLHYQIEMENADFTKGYTVGKFSHVKKQYRSGKVIYPFHRFTDVDDEGRKSTIKHVRVIFERAPPHIINDYEKKRTEIQEQEQEKYTRQLEQIHRDMTAEKIPKVSVKERVFELYRDLDAGMFNSLKEGCNARKLDYGYAKGLKKDYLKMVSV